MTGTAEPWNLPRSRVCSQGGATGAGDCGDLAAGGRAGADVAQQARQDRPNPMGAGGVLRAYRVAATGAQPVDLRISALFLGEHPR
jgi:hypothetical protein